MVGMLPSYGNDRLDEKTVVKNGLKQSLVEKAIWVPISATWFEKWEKYVENDGQDKEAYHPGPVENQCLKGSYGDELKRGMMEGQDYILLPKSVGEMLVNRYGGGPMFPRQVLRVEGTGSLYVSLYPTRIEVYHCNKENKLPVKDQFIIRYFNGNLGLDRAIKDLQSKFGIHEFTTSVRCWIKEYGENVTSIIKQRNNGTPAEEKCFRYLTADLVEWDSDDWKLYPDASHNNTGIKEILGVNKDCIEMILETYPSSMSVKENLWPRYFLLQKWKEFIQVGDYIDCQLNAANETKLGISRTVGSSNWYEGKVVEVNKEDDKQTKITVQILHPACREEKDFVCYTFPADYENIKPLHKCTLDRSSWIEDSELDVFVPQQSTDDGSWVIGKIKKKEGQQLIVEYQRPKIDSESTNTKAKTDAETLDDDSLKKSRAAVSTTTSSLNDIDDDSSTNEASVTECLELYDARLAPLNTYTAVRPIVPTYRYGSTFTSSTSSYGYNYGYNSYSTFDRHTAGKPEAAGVVGLQNLGNTCFLNSILQCLSNSKPLTDFFLHTDYKSLINYDNPLGTGGKVVKSYGQLLADIWSGGYVKAVPREIKHVIGELHPSFSGYEQQDAQECLSFLIDAMHEDCNQIKKKPFVQKIESNGRPDALISAESWRRFLLRNDSFIIDKCFGQLRSHVTCTNCSKESITFDEYATLSLPIPLNTKKEVEVIVQMIGSIQPIRVLLLVELTQSMKDFRALLVEKLKEYGILSDDSNLPLVPPSNTVHTSLSDQSLQSTNTTTTSEDSFEIVSPANEATKDNGVTIHNENVEDTFELVNSAAADTSSPSSVSPWQQTRSTSHFFHIATYSAGRNFVLSKEYNEKESGKVAITAYGNSRFDQFVVFQLSHPVPDIPPTFSTGYNRTLTSTTTSPASPNQYKSLDVVIGKVSTIPSGNIPVVNSGATTNTTPSHSYVYGATNRIELQSFVYRHSFVDGELSNRQLHDLAKALLAPFLSANANSITTKETNTNEESVGGMEYRLYISNQYGSVIKYLIPNNDDMFNHKEYIVDHMHNNVIAITVLPPQDGLNWMKMSQTIDIAAEQAKESLPLKPIKKDEIDIYDCLNKFIEREQLADTETIFCSACKQHLPPIKKMDLYTTPDILIIQLKRFQFVPGQYFIHREKINDVIQFPIEGLDLRKYVLGYPVKKITTVSGEAKETLVVNEEEEEGDEENLIYDLYAVSHHMGGLGGGHYTATCKNSLNNKWYYFNDSIVNETTPESAVNGTAYVLFYQRRKSSLKWGGMKPLPQGLPDENPSST